MGLLDVFLASKPNGLWLPGEPTGAATSLDRSGKGHPLTYVNSPTGGLLAPFVERFGATHFDSASSQHATMDGSQVVSATVGYSIAMVVRTTAPSGVLYAEGNSTDASLFPLLWAQIYPVDQLTVEVRPNSGTPDTLCTSSGAIADGDWHYWEFTDTPGGARIYIDGGLDPASPFTYTPGVITLDRVTVAAARRISVGSYASCDVALVGNWKRVRSPAEILETHNAIKGLLAPPKRISPRRSVVSLSPQVARPISTVSAGSWLTNASSAVLAPAIDEDVADDTDYIQGGAGVTSDVAVVGLGAVIDPYLSYGHAVYYRFYKSGTGTVDLLVELRQGTTVVASRTVSGISSGPTTGQFTLTAAETDAITDYGALRLYFTQTVSGVGPPQTERLAPDAILLQTNLVGTLSAITDDPDSPDASWLTASSTTVASILRVSFPTPSTPLLSPATPQQEFRTWVRKVGGSGTPTATLELWENGSKIQDLGAAQNVTSTTGQLVQGTFDASALSGLSGTNVECRVTGTVGGSGGTRATIEIGAVEWNAGDTAAPNARARVTWAQLVVPPARRSLLVPGRQSRNVLVRR